MPTRSYTSRRELEEYHFSAVFSVLAPLLLLLLQAYVPRLLPRLMVWTVLPDLPLIAVLFFSVSRRSPVTGSLTGAAIGLVQDLLTGNPIGVNGIAKSLIGYGASSIGLQVDVDNPLTRILMVFGFSMLQSVLLFMIRRTLLGLHAEHMLWSNELIRGALNTALALPLFYLADRFKQRD